MKTDQYSILFSSLTGNTKKLADAIHETLPQNDCEYFGAIKTPVPSSELLYIGIVSSVEAWHKELYNELSDSNIMAFISAWFEFKYRRYYFFYDVFNHKSRWNDYDRNFVLIISKIIASVL